MTPTGDSLESEKHRVLRYIHDRIGGRQVNEFAVSFTPSCILAEEFEKDFKENWEESIDYVPSFRPPATQT